jgi:Carboxypeptidase regulatory-like domain
MSSAIRLITAVVLLAAPSLALAQTATSSLRGTVTDPGGALIVGATVTFESKETGFHQVHKTEGDGGYQFQQGPPDTYTLTVESQGFARESSVVQLLVAQPSTLNLALRVTADTTVESFHRARAARQLDAGDRLRRPLRTQNAAEHGLRDAARSGRSFLGIGLLRGRRPARESALRRGQDRRRCQDPLLGKSLPRTPGP